MKKLLLLCLTLTLCWGAYAEERIPQKPSRQERILKKGYRGMADVGIGYCWDTAFFTGAMEEISTTHGYQFSPYVFLGAGVGFQYIGNFNFDSWKDDYFKLIPVYADVQVSFLKKWVTPILNLKGGYSFGDAEGVYLNPSAGVRFGFGRRLGLHVTGGYIYQELGAFGHLDVVQVSVGIDF